MDMSSFQNFGKNISSSFSPFAARTGQFMREQLGQAEDKVVKNPPSDAGSPGAAATATDSNSSGAAAPLDPADPSPTHYHHPAPLAGGTAAAINGLNAFAGFVNQMTMVHKLRRRLTEKKTQLPADYLELEKRVDALKLVHSKMLSVTSQYGNEAYDYPPNLRETFFDISRTVGEKVQLLAAAGTAAEAQQALTKPGPKSAPKTLNHALGRAALNSAHILDPSEPLATALEKYALASEKVGEARLQQDAQIVSRFNAALTTTMNTNINFAHKARKNVENARLSLDASKSRAKNGGLGFPVIGGAGRKEGHEDEHMTEEQRVDIENAEDEFIGCTEEAVGVMKNVLDTPEPLRNLADLIQAQLEFHKKAYEIYSDLAPLIETLQIKQEAERGNEFSDAQE